jgi:hypothetical protein
MGFGVESVSLNEKRRTAAACAQETEYGEGYD